MYTSDLTVKIEQAENSNLEMLKKLLVAIKLQDEHEAHKDKTCIFLFIYSIRRSDDKYYLLAFLLFVSTVAGR